jgi:hypothetical protein
LKKLNEEIKEEERSKKQKMRGDKIKLIKSKECDGPATPTIVR